MSAIAFVALLPKAVLPALRDAATPKKSLFGKTRDVFGEVLARDGREAGTYQWSGYVLTTLLQYLESRGVALMKSEFEDLALYLGEKRGATYFFLTQAHRTWLPDLDPGKYTEQELQDYHNEFNETDEPGAGQPMLDGTRFLRDAVAAVDDTTVALLSIS